MSISDAEIARIRNLVRRLEDILSSGGGGGGTGAYTGSFSGSFQGPVGGDLTGSLPDPIVDGFYGRPLTGSAPALNSTYRWDGTYWVPTIISGSTDGGSSGGGVISGSQTNVMFGESMVYYVGEPVVASGSWTAGAPNVPPASWTNATTSSAALRFTPISSSLGGMPKHTLFIRAYGTVQDIAKIGAVYYPSASLTGFTSKHYITKLVYPTNYTNQKIVLNSLELTYSTGSFQSNTTGQSATEVSWATVLIPNNLINVPTIIPSTTGIASLNNLGGYAAAGWMPMYFSCPTVEVFTSDGTWVGNTYYLNRPSNEKFLWTRIARSSSDLSTAANIFVGISPSDHTGFADTIDPSTGQNLYISGSEVYTRISVPFSNNTWEVENITLIKLKINF